MALSVTSRSTAFLYLIRWPNQLVLILCVLVFHVKLRQLAFPEQVLMLQGWSLAGFTGALLLLAAAGYLINDLRDQATDAINRPLRTWIPHPVSVSMAKCGYQGLLVLGGLLAAWTASRLQLWPWLALYPLIALGLHGYSSSWKGAGIRGNLLIATLSGLVPLILLIPETALLRDPAIRPDLLWYFGGFALFAFWASLFREIVKDLEDRRGDQHAGWQTMAVQLGPSYSKKAAILAGTILIILLLLAFTLGPWPFPYRMGLPLLALGQFSLIRMLVSCQTPAGYHRISQGSKALLAGGLLLLLVL